MKKKLLIISIIIILLISLVLIFLLPNKDIQIDEVDEVVARAVFKAPPNLSCISVDRESDYPENGVSAYVKGEQELDGIEYDGSDPEDFVYKLIENGEIVTFMHMYADVCLIDKQENNDSYLLEYKARHVYYTNSKNVETYNFTVEIDRDTKGVKIVTTN